MKKLLQELLSIAIFLFLLTFCKETQEGKHENETDLTVFVDPFIGTSAHGHTFPGACLPFGMVQLSPDNEKRGWDWCSGYHASDSIIIGFSHTHLSGTGCGDLQDILLMPTLQGAVSDTTKNGSNFIYHYKSSYSHDNESAIPGYYSVKLDDSGIKVELTATLRTGFHKYTYPQSENSKIIIDTDCKGGWDKMADSYIKIINDSTITGYSFSNGWASNQKVYFAVKLSKPCLKYYTSANGELKEGIAEIKGKSTKAIVCFSTKADEIIYTKVGLSSSSIDGAINNLNSEIAGWNFDTIKNKASKAWNLELNKFKVETNNTEQKKTFYTAVFHSFIAPNLYSDIDGKYTGMDNQIHKAQGYDNYFTFSLWDTYRAAHPLFTLTNDKKVSDFMNAMLSQYKESGLLPVWSLWGNETNCMIGYHAVPVIVDAYLKGIKGFDTIMAYDAIKNSAMQNIRETDLYRKYGYIPFDSVEMRIKRDKGGYNQSVSSTLEYAFDDWCIAQMANVLGKNDDYGLFMKRAQSYKNVADSSIGFMRPRNANGKWVNPFDPAKHGNGFTEGNSWQYSWYAPQDVNFLIKLMGGNDKFIAKLDTLFYQKVKGEGKNFIDVSGLIGQYAQGNEPSHHVAYLYNYAGAAWKTQKIVSLIRDSLYTSKRDGLCGNDDCGQMSAWYIFNALGFYPVNPAEGIYVIGTPLFEKFTIEVGQGKQFTVLAKNVTKKNMYIQSARLNGIPLETSYITHKDIKNGGVLEFEMGEKPNEKLWADPKAYPPSISAHNQ